MAKVKHNKLSCAELKSSLTSLKPNFYKLCMVWQGIKYFDFIWFGMLKYDVDLCCLAWF